MTPPKRRSTFRDSGDCLEWEIPTKKNAFALIFLALWLGGWVMGETSAIRNLSSSESFKPFLLFWLTGWTFGGAFAVVVWFWTAFGKELISVRAGELRLRRHVFGFGFSKEFELGQIKNLRVSPVGQDSQRAGLQYWGLGGGPVVFDYGARTFRFAASVDEAEATEIAGALRQRHPSLGTAA